MRRVTKFAKPSTLVIASPSLARSYSRPLRARCIHPRSHTTPSSSFPYPPNAESVTALPRSTLKHRCIVRFCGHSCRSHGFERATAAIYAGSLHSEPPVLCASLLPFLATPDDFARKGRCGQPPWAQCASWPALPASDFRHHYTISVWNSASRVAMRIRCSQLHLHKLRW